MEDKQNLTDMVVEIVTAFVSNNAVPPTELPSLIGNVHKALAGLGTGEEVKAAEPLAPAVPIKKSIGQDFIICLEDGRKFKSLKRHLRTKYGMSPEEYRAKWGLPKDYPMVAPAYAEARSNLAKQMGLGQGGRKQPAARRGRRPAGAA
ncbi:MucR family transcriptional regulator [Asticcacaulis solisilvae]|uniref:MucR family transcriptional regulator n=1 Tax=Asticcacaulis solisilvae TaxID=1217274 RepID=UPI003FD79A7E